MLNEPSNSDNGIVVAVYQSFVYVTSDKSPLPTRNYGPLKTLCPFSGRFRRLILDDVFVGKRRNIFGESFSIVLRPFLQNFPLNFLRYLLLRRKPTRRFSLEKSNLPLPWTVIRKPVENFRPSCTHAWWQKSATSTYFSFQYGPIICLKSCFRPIFSD